MVTYNRTFDLGLKDLELIETALQHYSRDLSMRRQEVAEDPARIDATLAQTNVLLGHLHNQKVFYRPGKADTPYVGG